MKNKKLRLILIPLMILLLAFTTLTASAAEGEEAGTYVIASVSISFEKTGFTTAVGNVRAIATGNIVYLKSKMTLQVYNNSTESYENTDSISTKYSYDNSIIHNHEFSISAIKSYRIKVEVTSCTDVTTQTRTHYRVMS